MATVNWIDNSDQFGLNASTFDLSEILQAIQFNPDKPEGGMGGGGGGTVSIHSNVLRSAVLER